LTKIAPENALAYFQLGQVLHKMGRLEAAVEAYQAAVDIFPENAIALTSLGNIHPQLGNPTAALDFYKKALLAQPGYVPAHNNIGEFYAYKLQDLTAAGKHFLGALSLDPDHVGALYNSGNLKMPSGSYSEAVKFFERVIAIDPKFVPAYGNLAFIHSLPGRNGEAIQYLRRVLEIDPHNVRAQNMLEQIEKAELEKSRSFSPTEMEIPQN
jgi:tetratricopeptide (TPR) repeat protein